MKKIIVSLSFFLSFSSLVHAQWALNGTNIYNTNGGNVGIGTQTPSNYFHGGNNKLIEISNPNTAINSQSHIILSTGATVDGSSAGTLTWVSKNSTGVQGMAYIGSVLQGDATTNAASKIVFATSNGSALSQKMIIDKDGNVGIGTPTPTSGLTIQKEGGNTADGALFLVNGANASFGGFATLAGIKTIAGDGGQYNFLKLQNAGGIKFLIDGAGNVGIGIASPKNKLDVNGTIHSKAVNVDLSGWSDYVFQKDYQLRPLSEVKAYIDQNQHLPEIPSEQQIVKEGLNLGEMNKLLMKKVEELTLYLIEQDKEKNEQGQLLQKQQEEINQLIKQVKALSLK